MYRAFSHTQLGPPEQHSSENQDSVELATGSLEACMAKDVQSKLIEYTMD